VALVARREAPIAELADELGNALAIPCDLLRPDELERPVPETLAAYGRLDILVNNAGMSHTGPAVDEPVDTFRQVLELNLVAPFALAAQAAAHMLERGEGGSIVNVASMFGLVGLGRIPQASYAASKGGLVNLTRELAGQWSRSGIRVNALAPGWFPSEMTEGMFATERGQEWIARSTPMDRGGLAHELDGALLFLAGDASTYVTGHVLSVDGGWTAV
jgi:NAD(P)-dependent dehydrogenase (short-subunit alcohol dehydrogenase family)